MVLQYTGGPLDGEKEVRSSNPRIGDLVHRLVGQRYVSYKWDGSRFVHVAKR